MLTPWLNRRASYEGGPSRCDLECIGRSKLITRHLLSKVHGLYGTNGVIGMLLTCASPRQAFFADTTIGASEALTDDASAGLKRVSSFFFRPVDRRHVVSLLPRDYRLSRLTTTGRHLRNES